MWFILLWFILSWHYQNVVFKWHVLHLDISWPSSATPHSVMSSAPELTIAASNGTENAAPIYREKTKAHKFSLSEGPCFRPGRKFSEKDGIQITFSPTTQNEWGDMERSILARNPSNRLFFWLIEMNFLFNHKTILHSLFQNTYHFINRVGQFVMFDYASEEIS